jgi:hypothetical protein
MSAGALRSTRLTDAAAPKACDSPNRRTGRQRRVANRQASPAGACSGMFRSFTNWRRGRATLLDLSAVIGAWHDGRGSAAACGHPVDDTRRRRPRIAREASIGAAWRQMDLATMRTQQAVAINFVGRRVSLWTCLFFSARTGHLYGRFNRPSPRIPNGLTRPPTRPNRRNLHCCLSSRCRMKSTPAGAPDARPTPGSDTTRTT